MPTKVFISWSGDLSRKLGEALRDWLPKTLQSVKPYFSPNDIEKGTRWDAEVAGELEASDIGIICVTPDNTERPWILFEAGALSKALEKARVCPLLFGGLKPADVSGPLASFQLTQFKEDDFRKLAGTINDALGESRLADADFAEVFDMWWPRLAAKVAEIQEGHEQGPAPEHRSDREVLEELLGLVRAGGLQSTGARVGPRMAEWISEVCFRTNELWDAVEDTLDSWSISSFCDLWVALWWLCSQAGMSGLYEGFAHSACVGYGERGLLLAQKLMEEYKLRLPPHVRAKRLADLADIIAQGTAHAERNQSAAPLPLDTPPEPE